MSEPTSSVALRMVVGICAFSLALFFLLYRNTDTDPLGLMYLIVGGVFGAAATVVTRGAGRRPLGRLLTALGYIWLCGIATILLLPLPRSDADIELQGQLSDLA